jgi:hypothetical protein
MKSSLGPATTFQQPLPFPLSSRAKSRDLQFRGPLLEMFFDSASLTIVISTEPSPEGLGSALARTQARRCYVVITIIQKELQLDASLNRY